MDGAVKMPGAQVRVNAANRVQSAQTSGTGVEFIKLLQAKGDQTKTSSQEKTQTKTETTVKKPSKDGKDKTDSLNGEKVKEETAGKTETKEVDDADAMAQQAAAEQTAALLAGMLVENQEVNAGEALPGTEAVGAVEVPAEVVSEMPVIADEHAAELNLAQNLAEATEVKPETVPQAAVLEAAEQPEKAMQAEVSQPVKEEAVKETKPVENKAEKPEPEKVNEPVQDAANASKAEEKPEAGKQSGQENLTEKNNARADRGIAVDAENSQAQAAAGAESFKVFGHQQNGIFGQKAETVSMRTTPETMPQDLGKALGAKFAEGARTLTVELEPANLGKLTIRLTYEGDRAAVSIMATNPKTLELLNQKASEIASILEEKTGQETLIYTQKPETNQENYDRNPDGKREREEQEERHQQQNKEEHQSFDSFAQQLRLGLV